jgi:hypothetical protein
MRTETRRPWWRSRWWIPLFSLFLGTLILLASWLGDATGEGLYGFAIMALFGLVFLLGGRSETLRGLGGPGRDERWTHIDVYATAFSGLVLITVLITVWLWEIAHGRDGSPYGQVLAIGGIAYIAGIAFMRFRS